MERIPTPPGRLRGNVELSILALGRSSLTAADLAAMRQRPIENLPTPLRPQFLKHSDDQSLAALAAVERAIAGFPPGTAFEDWAIISASRYLGRESFAAAIDKYQVDGPWGVSVHVIPHATAHAVAGTLSLALNCHGPCIGAAAAAEDELQAVLSLAAFLERPTIGGAWFVSTGFAGPERNCVGVALAVVNPSRNEIDLEMMGRIVIESPPDTRTPRHEPAGSQVALADFLATEPIAAASWRGASGGLRIAVELSHTRAETKQSRWLGQSLARQRTALG